MAAAPPTEDLDTLQRLRLTIETLEQVIADRGLMALLPEAERIRLRQVVAACHTPDAAARRKLMKALNRQRKSDRAQRDDRVLATAGIRSLHRRAVTTPNFLAPAASEQSDARDTLEPLHCYICKQAYTTVHHFYDRLCPACADLNFRKRTELAHLSGRVALLTGGRVKIGFQIGLKLLRSGARLLVTTRFPRDAAARYAQEPDFADWSDRLEIFGLDLRHTPSIEAFCHRLVSTRDRLDFIINNACQTVRRPPAFYAHMMAAETTSAMSPIEGGLAIADSAQLSQVPLLPDDHFAVPQLFPAGQLDENLQQVDLRGRNSWRLLLDEVSSVEFLEVQLVNAVAPFIFNARLKPLMLRAPGRDKHIVNVSAVEGQFYRRWKTTRHPHTNMAKAALNMMTRTSATDYHADGIHMNSVDTGWVTDEDPVDIAERKTRDQRFTPPLDIVDGAARVVDPIIDGINTGTHVWGQFLKDYTPTDW